MRYPRCLLGADKMPEKGDGVSGWRLYPHRPIGDVFEVMHFHNRFRYEHKGISLSNGRVAIALAEKVESIWIMSRSDTIGASKKYPNSRGHP